MQKCVCVCVWARSSVFKWSTRMEGSLICPEATENMYTGQDLGMDKGPTIVIITGSCQTFIPNFMLFLLFQLIYLFVSSIHPSSITEIKFLPPTLTDTLNLLSPLFRIPRECCLPSALCYGCQSSACVLQWLPHTQVGNHVFVWVSVSVCECAVCFSAHMYQYAVHACVCMCKLCVCV